jgi:hypothetical protein
MSVAAYGLNAPPPCAQQSPFDTAVFVHASSLQFLPPPWDQHTPRDLARLSQPSIVHLVEPPAHLSTSNLITAITLCNTQFPGFRTVFPAYTEIFRTAGAPRHRAALPSLSQIRICDSNTTRVRTACWCNEHKIQQMSKHQQKNVPHGRCTSPGSRRTACSFRICRCATS